jgi:hypothetical protein
MISTLPTVISEWNNVKFEEMRRLKRLGRLMGVMGFKRSSKFQELSEYELIIIKWRDSSIVGHRS